MSQGYENMTNQQRAMWLIGQLSNMFSRSNKELDNAFKLMLLTHLPKVTQYGKDSRNRLAPVWEKFMQAKAQEENEFFKNLGDAFA